MDGLKRLSKPVTLKAVAKVGSPAQLVRHAARLRQNDDKAVERAKALGAGNPSSEVWRLVEVVRKH